MLALTPLARAHTSFFWSAPFADESEFLPLDPLALDYLGQQGGLWLFPGFTTRTNRAQYYAVVLYGLALADKAIAEYGEPNDDETRVALFERWERFWAMAVLESREGRVERGDPDAMRGVRGAKKVYTKNDRPIRLDFPLISRQEELGGLGAYLSSLRHYQFVMPGSYRPTRLDEEIVHAFWDEPDANARHSRYEAYALLALDRRRTTVERKVGNITLAEVGRRSRLSVLHERKRTQQQARLYERLFTTAKGPTPVLGSLIENAWRKNIREPEAVIDSLLEGGLGAVDTATRELVDFTKRFGRAAQHVLQAFNDLYTVIVDAGWMLAADEAVRAAFADDKLAGLRLAARDFLDASLVSRFRNLPSHASGFVKMMNQLRDTHQPSDAVESILHFHRGVLVDRRQAGSWIRRDGEKYVVDLTNWSGIGQDVRFPNFRINTVQRLLLDLGRIEE